MRKSVPGLAVLTALAPAVLGLIIPPAPSVAQQGPTKSSQAIAADLLFAGPESVDMRAGPGAGTSWLVDFVKKAQASGSQCPLDVNVTVMYGPKDAKDLQNRTYDPLLSQALAAARRDVLSGILEGFGPSVRVTANITKGIVNLVMVDAQTAQDKEKPKLHTTSVPPKGSRVKPGQEIVVTMKARDDANRWQSGIKTVTLVADSEGDRLIAGPTYPPHAAAGCTDTPPEREVRAIYIVPANPPPIVRLTATAMDHVGLTDFDVGEFPTGDFYGTMTRVGGTPPHQLRGRADFVLNHDGKGNLTGTMIGQVEFVAASYLWQPARPERGSCSASTKQPNRFRVSLVGSYTEGSTGSPTVKVFFKDAANESALIVNHRCPNGSSDAEAPAPWFQSQAGAPAPFLGTPAPLGDGDLRPDGSRHYQWEGGARETVTVTLHHARN